MVDRTIQSSTIYSKHGQNQSTRGDFLLQLSPTLYVYENEKLRLQTEIGEMVKIFLIDIFRSGHGTTPPPKFLKF